MDEVEKAVRDLHSAPIHLADVQKELIKIAGDRNIATPRMVAQPVDGRIFLHLTKHEWNVIFTWFAMNPPLADSNQFYVDLFNELIEQFEYVTHSPFTPLDSQG